MIMVKTDRKATAPPMCLSAVGGVFALAVWAGRATGSPVSYATDRTENLSTVPSTSSIGVNGVGDRWRLGSMA
jgi:hypothetical protein